MTKKETGEIERAGGARKRPQPAKAALATKDQGRKKTAQRASEAPRRTGRPNGTRNKPEKPGRVIATGFDVPRLTEALSPPRDELQAPFGRPPKYQPHFAVVARAMARLGAGDFEIAEELDVRTSTIWRWRARYPDFCSALEEGKEAFDNRIERSLAQRAAGYSRRSFSTKA